MLACIGTQGSKPRDVSSLCRGGVDGGDSGGEKKPAMFTSCDSVTSCGFVLLAFQPIAMLLFASV